MPKSSSATAKKMTRTYQFTHGLLLLFGE